MTVKRFFGETAREALRKVKETLGQEAVVISNKAVPGGVEIMAMSADTLEALQGVPGAATPVARPAAAKAAAASAPRAPAAVPPTQNLTTDEETDDYAVTLSAKARAPQPVQAWQPWRPPREETPAAPPPQEPRARLRPLPPRPTAPSSEQVALSLAQAALENDPLPTGDDVRQIMDEMRSIKSLLERQLAGFAWNGLTRHAPVGAQLLGEMIEAGFSGQLARQLVETMPAELTVEEGRKWLVSAVNRRLRTLTTENDLVERGGVFALVGPTGVGDRKSTRLNSSHRYISRMPSSA
jgi:flagellar biosynthesis protein FlhF